MLTAKNQDQLRNATLGNWVWATFTFLPSHAVKQRANVGVPACYDDPNYNQLLTSQLDMAMRLLPALTPALIVRVSSKSVQDLANITEVN